MRQDFQSQIHDTIMSVLDDYQRRSGLTARQFGLLVAGNQVFLARVRRGVASLRTVLRAERRAAELWPDGTMNGPGEK